MRGGPEGPYDPTRLIVYAFLAFLAVLIVILLILASKIVPDLLA